MARFVPVPDIPTTVTGEWETQLLDALKQNVELLVGLRGAGATASQAVTRGMVQAQLPVRPLFSHVDELTALGEGVSISGQDVPTLVEYRRLLLDVHSLATNVQRLATDLAALRDATEALLFQLRGS